MDVKEINRLSEGQESVSLVSVLHCTHDVESIKCMVLRPPECDPSIQGKNKKKKKKPTGWCFLTPLNRKGEGSRGSVDLMNG